MPSYLSKTINNEYKHKVSVILNELSNDKMTLQNKKILKLAYGFTDNNFETNLNNDSELVSQQTDESNLELLDDPRKNIRDSAFQNLDRFYNKVKRETLDHPRGPNILQKLHVS